MLKHTTSLAWATFFFAVIAVGWAPVGQRFPAVLLCAFVFAAVLTWVPRCRPRLKPMICPWNWALFVFALQLVGLPLLITLDRPSVGVLPALPSPMAINVAMALNCTVFLIVCGVYNQLSELHIADHDATEPLPSVSASQRIDSPRWTAIAALLGGVGLSLSFGKVADILRFFNDPSFYTSYFADASSTWRGLAALLLKPFLGFAVVVTWCRWMDMHSRNFSRVRRVGVTILALAATAITFNLVGYNRGAFVVPLVAVAAVALVKADALSRAIIVSIGICFLVLMPAYAIYRSGTDLGEDLLARADVSEMLMDNVDISDMVQMYGGAPQYLGFLLERSRWGQDPHWGTVTLSSILSPLPVVGKSFRRQSGFAIYNHLIYGTDAIADQNPSFVGEAFLDFHVVGVVFGYAIFGWIMYHLQRSFDLARSSAELYVWQYLSIWMSFVIFGSIDVLSQILIYSCWPIYAFWFLARKSRRHGLYTGIAGGYSTEEQNTLIAVLPSSSSEW